MNTKLLLPVVLVLLSNPGFAGEPKASDYPVDFLITYAAQASVSNIMMTLDGGGMTYTVVCDNNRKAHWQHGEHGCALLTSGKHVRGRVITQERKKRVPFGSWIALFWLDEKGEPRTQEWTVNAAQNGGTNGGQDPAR